MYEDISPYKHFHIHAIHTMYTLVKGLLVPQVAVGPGEVHGVSKLADHFRRIAERGGQLEEVDKMTTTTGTHTYIHLTKYIHTCIHVFK